MSKSVDYIELVTEAQFGDKDCLERLAEIATVRLRAHVYRLTLRDDVTQDIVQESVLEMIKILVKEIGKSMGKEKGNTKYLYELYPAGPAKQACRFAGLPKPTGCV